MVIHLNNRDNETEVYHEDNSFNNQGIETLLTKIKEMFKLDEIKTNDFFYVSNLEQLTKIENCKKNIIDLKQGLINNIPIDMLEQDLKNIWQTLGEVIGETYTEELLDNIFKNFCVGK